MAKQSNLKNIKSRQSVWATIQIMSRQTESARQLVENLRKPVSDSNKRSTRSTMQRNGADRAGCDPMLSGIYAII